MDVAISGQAGVALLFEGKRLYSLHRANPSEVLPRSPNSIRHLFGGAQDVEVFQNIDRERAERELLLASRQADALHLALLALDSGLSEEARADCVQELEELLADDSVSEYVRGVLWSHPLPEVGDIGGAKAFAKSSAPRALLLFAELGRDQGWIQLVWAAWTSIPDESFANLSMRNETRALAVRRGIFPLVVSTFSAGRTADETQILILSSPQAKSVPGLGQVISSWLTPFRQGDSRQALAWKELAIAGEVPKGVPAISHLSEQTSEGETISYIERQKVDLLKALREGQFDRFSEALDELIAMHLTRPDGPDLASEMLCRLAGEARALGHTHLQVELASKAVELAPEDGSVWTLYAEALLAEGETDKAVLAGETVRKLGRRASH